MLSFHMKGNRTMEAKTMRDGGEDCGGARGGGWGRGVGAGARERGW